LPYGSKVIVQNGDTVYPGSSLTAGSIFPNDLLRTKGMKVVQEYLINQILSVYFKQDVKINPKHLEIIIRQMSRRVQIEDSGDTQFIAGSYVDLNEFEDQNKAILMEGGVPASAKPLLLSITKASSTSESFLSAASFQETSSVLTEAAVKGKVDYLHGLKENVMVGKLIPAGTGVKMYRDLMPRVIQDIFDHTVSAELKPVTTDTQN
jgi:DNA-directed RNA polymerase subunit beta'